MKKRNDTIIHALAIELPATDEATALPDEIQWMPPGKHRIRASKNGKPAEMDITVTDVVASRVAEQFEQLKASGRRPYLDFNHEGGRASARVEAVRWAGDDPKTGGVRVRVSWTKSGGESLRAKEYFSFSPTFRLNEHTGEVIGTTVNMGGLVNEPAFTAIAPVVAHESSEETETEESEKMKKIVSALVRAKVLTSDEVGEDQAVSAIDAAFASVNAREQEIATLKQRNAELETQVKTAKTQRAESIVDAAIAAGRIPAKDNDTRAYWVESIVNAGERAEKALNALPVNPALSTAAVVNGSQRQDAARQAATEEHAFLVKARAVAKERNVSLGVATGIVSASEPALYADYRESLQ